MVGENKENIVDGRVCCLCGEKEKESITHGFEVDGVKKYVCQNCADTIHGVI
jgi:hypothetical protein